MDGLEKLAAVSNEVQFEQADERIPARPGPLFTPQPCGHSPAELKRRVRGETRFIDVPGKSRPIPIYMSAAGGKVVPLLKAMLTTACERNCFYCPFRAGRGSRRVTFKPEEMARTFADIHRSGAVEGLFLSSGVFAGGPNTQNKLLDSAEYLRRELQFRGYLHLKLMPGCERGQVQRAMQLADRVSINLEAPNAERLARLAPKKIFYEELLTPLRWADEIRHELPAQLGWNGRWASTTTQFVVGAAGENDLEILSTAAHVIQRLGVRRTYFEAFNPVLDTPLENHPPQDPLRQFRLYEASYLLRDYGFDLEELPFRSDGLLPLDRDPKRAAADRAFTHQPVEINRADQEMLLRIPGIGPRGVKKLLAARRQRALRDLSQLRRLGVVAERAAPYITLAGKRPPRQLNYFGQDEGEWQ